MVIRGFTLVDRTSSEQLLAHRAARVGFAKEGRPEKNQFVGGWIHRKQVHIAASTLLLAETSLVIPETNGSTDEKNDVVSGDTDGAYIDSMYRTRRSNATPPIAHLEKTRERNILRRIVGLPRIRTASTDIV